MAKARERDIMRREGQKTSALETTRQRSQDRPDLPERVRERVPEREISLDMAMNMGM